MINTEPQYCSGKYGPHDLSVHGRPYRNTMRCRACHTELMRERRRDEKLKLLEIAGGAFCSICGWDETPSGLDLHHFDPTTKSFTIGDHKGKEHERLAEAEKCVVLCRNCHAVAHDQEEGHPLGVVLK